MPGLRTLIVLLALVAVVVILRRLMRSRSTHRRQQLRSVSTVRCAQCGLALPESEALAKGDRFFCSAAHRDRYREGQD